MRVEEALLPDGSREAYVNLPDGRSLSAEIVRAGLAWPSTRRAGRLAKSLAVLELGAMSDRRGVFSEPGPLAEEPAAGETAGATLGENE